MRGATAISSGTDTSRMRRVLAFLIDCSAELTAIRCSQVEKRASPRKVGSARIARAGNDVTVVAWSAMVHEALAAADLAAEAGLDMEVIDLRTLWPWDRETVFRSVARTGRLIVAQEAVQVGGFGAEIAASVAEALAGDLKAPVRRLGSPRAPISYSGPLEDRLRVTAAQIAETAREVLVA